MANKKRDRNGYRKKLGRYRLNRKDLLVLEKIIRQYSNSLEMKRSHQEKTPHGVKRMRRRFADCHIRIGRYQPFYMTFGKGEVGVHYPGVKYLYEADSVKFLPNSIRKARYVEISCKPGISITLRPFSTEISAQTHYATGKELNVMNKTIASLEEYLQGRKKSLLTICLFG